jgi:polyisoprenoid-binding protein YceI
MMRFGLQKWALASALAVTMMTGCNITSDKATTSAANPWQVDINQSSISFVTLKSGTAGVGGVSEIQTFNKFSGSLDPQGQIRFDVDLASVNTGIEIRDQRMKTMLWNITAAPKASFVAKLDATAMAKLSESRPSDFEVNGMLSMAGKTTPIVAKLRASRLSSGSIIVATSTPIIVNANDFGLKAGVEALREVVGLNFLASTAPVTFFLVLHAKS